MESYSKKGVRKEVRIFTEKFKVEISQEMKSLVMIKTVISYVAEVA
jgi:hypothetical protein